MYIWILLIAVSGDLLWGDPGGRFHPVALIGKLISYMEKLFYSKHAQPAMQFMRGLAAAGCVLAVVTAAAWTIAVFIQGAAAVLIQGVLLSFAISARTLVKRGIELAQALKSGDIVTARARLSYIVSRDTHALEEQDVIRGTIETMAENLIDGVIAPLFWFTVFGLPGAYLYRASNTLDAMLGYKNERYEYFGKFAARTDDFLNYIPARLGGLIMLAAGGLLGYSPLRALKVWLSDAKEHPSPNAGIPESIVAGFLGIRLGGRNYYGGKEHFRCYLGTAVKPFEIEDIYRLRKILYITTLICTLFLTITMILGRFPWTFYILH